jgi:hypothetical protein
MASTSAQCHKNPGFAGAATRPGQTGRPLFPNGRSSLEDRHNTGHFRVMEPAIFPGTASVMPVSTTASRFRPGCMRVSEGFEFTNAGGIEDAVRCASLRVLLNTAGLYAERAPCQVAPESHGEERLAVVEGAKA